LSTHRQFVTPDADHADDRDSERRIARSDVDRTIGRARNAVCESAPWATRAKNWFAISGIKKPIVLVCCARVARAAAFGR